MTTRIRFLGGVDVTGGGAALSSRATALLAYLVTHAGNPQPRGHLADLLWPDSDSPQARTNLRRELHHLRARLGADSGLDVASTALTWWPHEHVEVDLETFDEARRLFLAATDGDPVDPDASVAGRHLRRALDAYQGVFLPGCYDDWALAVREELQTSCVDLYDRAAVFHQALGDLDAAIDAMRHRIGLAPLEEPGYRRLMSLQQATGDRAGALRTYHRCASLLEQELGVAPSLETRHELDALLNEAADPGGAPVRVGLPAAPPGLVGREAELRRLCRLWTTAAAVPRFALVTGEAGVGKTRLVSDLAARVRAERGLVVTARCFAATQGLPLAPVAEWLRTPPLRSAAARLEPVWQAEVERLVPDGDVLDPAPSSRAKIDAWQRLRFFEGLARAVLAIDRPLLLVADDLQWADSATLSWLSFLLSLPSSCPLLVVGTARDDEQGPNRPENSLGAMQAAGQVETVPLGPLSFEETRRLADALVPHPLGEDELLLVHSVTAGNPFFVIEALRESQASVGPIRPADLAGVLTNRFSRLSEAGGSLMGLAAAVGRDFGLELLIEASDLTADAVVQAVDELWRRRILDQRGQGYDFAHSLLRDSAYRSVPPARRWLVHRRLAQALELLYRDREDLAAAQLAEQYDRSGQPERALPFYDRAARSAAAVFAHAEAVRIWQRCAELLDDTPAGADRDQRQLAIIEQLLPPLGAWRGYASVELEAYERLAHDLAQRLDRVEPEATASIALFATTFVQGHIAESHEWGQQALALAEESPQLLAQAHMAVAGSALGLGRVQVAKEHFAHAVLIAGESDSLPIGTRTGVHARSWEAHALWADGDADGARRACEEGLERASRTAHPYSVAVALAYAAVTYQMLGDRDALRGVLAELTEVCTRYEFAYYRDWATVLTGWLHGGAAGVEQVQRGIARLESEGSLARMPYWLWLLADLHRSTGDDQAALAVLDAASAVAVHNDDLWWLPEVLRARASLVPTAQRAQVLDRALVLARQQGSWLLANRCRADLDQSLAPRPRDVPLPRH